MSGKSAKKRRREMKKFNYKVFSEFMVEVSAMPFHTRFWFCLKMVFTSHELQKGLMPEIKARRRYDLDGKPVAWYNRPIGDLIFRRKGR